MFVKITTRKMKSFADYKQDAANWITMANGEYYPDILTDACELYKPVLALFGQLLRNIRILHQATTRGNQHKRRMDARSAL